MLLGTLIGKEDDAHQQQSEEHQTADVTQAEVQLGVDTQNSEQSQQDTDQTLTGNQTGSIQNTGLNSLFLGVLVSMFTAVVVTKWLIKVVGGLVKDENQDRFYRLRRRDA